MKADLKTPKYAKNEIHCFVARAVFLQMGDIMPPKGHWNKGYGNSLSAIVGDV